MRPALHIRHHRPAKGLRAAERIFSLCRPLVRQYRRPDRAERRHRADADAAAGVPHECDGLFRHGDGDHRRLPDRARSLPPQELVGQRARQPRHHRALSRRHAADADGRARKRRRQAPWRALRIWRRRRQGAARSLRSALRLSAGRGLGHDRDRRRRRGGRLRENRATPARAASAVRVPNSRSASLPMVARRPTSTSPANCWFAMPARAALRFLPRISQGRRGHRGSVGRRLVSYRRRREARARMVRFISSTARRTSSAAPAKTSRRSRSRAC